MRVARHKKSFSSCFLRTTGRQIMISRHGLRVACGNITFTIFYMSHAKNIRFVITWIHCKILHVDRCFSQVYDVKFS